MIQSIDTERSTIFQLEGKMKKYLLSRTFIVALCIFSADLHAFALEDIGSGVQYEELVLGDGMKAIPQSTVTINIAIWADSNGQKGDTLYSSYEEGGRPMSFVVGTKRIADGLSIGVTGMRVGGKRRLYVPSHLNPPSGSGKFPGNVNLIYEVELLDVK